MQGLNAEGLNARLTQVVFTATGVPGVTSARVLINGGTVLGVFPGIDASVPLTRSEPARRPRAPRPLPTPPGTGAPTADDRGAPAAAGRPRASCPPTRSTGASAPRTTTAVIAFQKWARLGRDGVAGPATLAALADRRAPRPGHGRRPRAPGGAAARPPGRAGDREQRRRARDPRLLGRRRRRPRRPAPTPSRARRPRSWSVPFQVWLPYAAYFVGGIAFHEYPDGAR